MLARNADRMLGGSRRSLGHLALDREHVVELAVEDLGPGVFLGANIDPLHRGTKPVAHLQHAAFVQRVDREFRPDRNDRL